MANAAIPTEDVAHEDLCPVCVRLILANLDF